MIPGPSAAPESVLVVRLGAMGDVIHTLAAVTALRAVSPSLRIGWVIENRWVELLCTRNSPPSGTRNAQRPVADVVHTVDTRGWRKSPFRPETRGHITTALNDVREQGYEVAADFQGALKSALIGRFAGAKKVIGFSHPREAPARFLYNQRFAARGTHVIEHYRSLAEAIAHRSLPDYSPTFPLDEQAEASIADKLAGNDKETVLINPGAGWGAKQWPAGQYAEVARALASDGLRPIVNFGPGEQDLASKVQQASGGIAEPLSCSISELVALTRHVKLFIGGDTGPLHLAAALRVPVVAVFGPTDPARNGPYGTNTIVLRNPLSRNSLSHTSAPDPGLLNITAAEVISAARKLLENTGA